MKAAAQFAAAYGIMYRPSGLTENEAMTGLVVNIQRIRAQRVLDQSTSFAIAAAGEIPDDVLDAASDSPGEASRAKVAAWASAGRAHMQSVVRGSR